MLRGILTVGGWTMASRVLGFVRDILIAAFMGAGPVADAFVVANRLPNLFRRLFGEGAFNAAFVPGFTGLLATEGHDAAQRFAEQAAAVMAFWLVGLTVVAEIFMPVVIRIIAPGFVDDPAKFALAVDLCRIAFPYMPMICLTALFSGVLNGLDRFAAAAAAPLVANVVSIGCMLALVHVLPTPGHALAWGVIAAGVCQLALLVWAVRAAGMRLHLPRPRLTPRMRQLLRRMAPGLLAAGVTQLNLSVDMIIGSLLPSGVISVLYYANQLNQLPLGVIGAAIGTALLPTLSRLSHAGDQKGAVATLNRALEYALLLTLPAALALMAVSRPIVEVLFQRGRFDATAVELSAQALSVYAAGLVAFVLVRVLLPAFFARGDTTTPVRIGLGAVALNLALNVALVTPLQHLGPPLASTISAWANVAVLVTILIGRGDMQVDATLLRVVPRMLLAGLAMVAALLALDHLVYARLAYSPIWRVAGLAVLVGGGMVVYFAAGQLGGAFDIRRLRRRRASSEVG
jgi:putative peptidoglycan lipid II flippase